MLFTTESFLKCTLAKISSANVMLPSHYANQCCTSKEKKSCTATTDN